MGEMFRSEKMALCQMFIQPEAAYASVAELGEIGCVQFRDLNEGVNTFQRKFVNEVRRCNELENKILYFENELRKDGIVIPEDVENIPKTPNPREIIELESHLQNIETELVELANNELNINKDFLGLLEMLKVLENTSDVFSSQEVLNLDVNKRSTKLNAVQGQSTGNLGFVAGVIRRERVFAFERMLWRISHGNIFVKRVELEEHLKDPLTGESVYKTIFVVFFQGEQLRNRVTKICIGFRASMYACPSAFNERQEMMKGIRTRIEDMQMVLNQTQDHRAQVLSKVCKELFRWSVMIQKMKAIYHILNMFNIDVSQKLLIGECWIPTLDLPIVQNALAEGSEAVGSTVPSFLNVIDGKEEPPTYFRTNRFTHGFQSLIDAYGVGAYREVNPALYTCITFPFLFGVMFGDFGHGFILVLVGAVMAIYEKKLENTKKGEIFKILFAGRYIILLMGFFAMYTGFCYNEIFSISMNIFGSTWSIKYNSSTILSNEFLQLNPQEASTGVYPLGVDPVWQMADNKIIFTNTFKMKLSIILGVAHMIFGVCLSVVNFVHFKRYSNIILQFVPQILFLLLLFGYMVFMMFFKWVQYTPYTDYQPYTPGCAPSVLIMFINMMLFKDMDPLPGCEAYMFTFQPTLEMIFVILAVVCIPWMLLGKPLYIMCIRKFEARKKQATAHLDLSFSTAAESYEDGGFGPNEEEDEPMGEIYIHQAIHTVEYVLSTISHTASYLRLWALSLAHSELSEVLWTMVMHIGLSMKGYIGIVGIFFIFAIWAAFTIAILVVMEGLSAFLHTLRLHWVEFMSKFYAGTGYAFQPFSFKCILEGGEEE